MTSATSMEKNRTDEDIRRYYTPLFAPKRIAVVGASSTAKNRSNVVIERLRRFGFTGEIYPIHPTASAIDGLPAYPSLGETPEPVDYAYVAVPAAKALDVIRQANQRVRFAHVISSGFAEISGGASLQDELVQAARQSGVRILGPNCPGAYAPKGGLIFVENSPPEPGGVGIVSQSGGVAMDIIWSGSTRGIRFSAVMTTGNTADVDASDLLEYYLADPDTKIIGMYLESIRDGRRFFNVLQKAKGRKPVVILKSGRSEQGQKAAASHTGALAGDDRIWDALLHQTGAIRANDTEALLDTILALQMLTPRPARPTHRAVLFGNGGGTGVIATDTFARHRLDVVPFGEKTIQGLNDLDLPPGLGLMNPIDTPAGGLHQEKGRIAEDILNVVLENEDFDALVMHINLPVILTQVVTDAGTVKNLLNIFQKVKERHRSDEHFVLVLRSDGQLTTEENKTTFRSWALERGIPVFDQLVNAAVALENLGCYERFIHDRT